MAAPHVAGAFAIYNSAFGKQTVSNVVFSFVASSKTSYDQSTNITLPFLHMEKLFTTPPVTTTTIFPTTTTTSSTTTIPSTTTTVPTQQVPRVMPPILLELDGRFRTFVWVKYKDPFVNKSFIKHYELVCNNTEVYIIPLNPKFSLQNHRLNVLPSNISQCYMYGVLINNTKTSLSSTKRITPRNNVLSTQRKR